MGTASSDVMLTSMRRSPLYAIVLQTATQEVAIDEDKRIAPLSPPSQVLVRVEERGLCDAVGLFRVGLEFLDRVFVLGHGGGRTGGSN